MARKARETGYGKYEKYRGAIVHLNEVKPARSPKEIIGKGGGKTTNYPMDNEDVFERRLARHIRQQEMEAEAAKSVETAAPEASGADPKAA